LDSVLAEIEQAREQGQTIDVRHYLDRYPDLAESLSGYFRDREWFARVAPRLSPTTPQAAAPALPPELPPGGRFGAYEIVGQVGRGGMGVVYKARQLAPEREVALKVIRTDRLADLPADEQRQWLERFRREAQLVASLEQHPNLVTLYEVGEHEGRPFFTMQLVRGGSLAEAMRGGQWAVGTREAASRSARLVATVARAVHHVHQRGVLHRDLKPANILLDEAGRPPGQRLRSGPAARPLGEPGGRRHRGDRGVHGPGAGARPAGRGDDGGRRLQPGGGPLRALDGPAALQRGERPRHAAAADRPGAAAAAVTQPALVAGLGNHLPQRPAKGARPALRLGGGAGGGPGMLAG
jgi:hypothetical protein